MSTEDDYPCPQCSAPMNLSERDLFVCPECNATVDLRDLAPGYKTPPFTQPKELPMPELVPPPLPTPAPSKLSQVLALVRKVAPGTVMVLMALEGALTPGTVVHGIVKAVADVGKMLLGLLG